MLMPSATASGQPMRTPSCAARPRTSRQVPALDVLDDDVRLAARVGRGLEDLRDARVMELRLDARLVEEAREEGAVRVVVAPDDLDDHRPFGALDAAGRGEEHLAHAAAGDALEQRKRSKRGAAAPDSWTEVIFL